MATAPEYLNTPAILLKTADSGENDAVFTFFTRRFGKMAVFARAAKKSRKRFGGKTGLFHTSRILVSKRSCQLGVLQEISLKRPLVCIPNQICRLAYAAYWAETVLRWVEPEIPQENLFALLNQSLETLDRPECPPETASILFQLHFLKLMGLSPGFTVCHRCGCSLDAMPGRQVGFELENGGILCHRCRSGSPKKATISKQTLKLLAWQQRLGSEQGRRAVFSPDAQREALAVLEAFVPFHLGCPMKSLSFLKQIRRPTFQAIP